MFITVTYSHPDFAYHTVAGPFDTVDEAQKHAEKEVNWQVKEFPETRLRWSSDGMFAENGEDRYSGTYVYIHDLGRSLI